MNQILMEMALAKVFRNNDGMQRNMLLLESKITACTFHAAMKLSIRLAQFFSFFPINVGGATHKSLKFKWLHWRVLYATATFLFFVSEFLVIVAQYLRSTTVHSNMLIATIIIFHVGAITQLVLLFKLTLEWPKFVREWHTIEVRLKNYELHCNLSRKLNATTSTIMALAGVEHSLVIAYKIIRYIQNEPTIYEGFKSYFQIEYRHVFDIVEYSVWKGIILQFLNLQRTFIWSYADVLVMIIGSAFTFRLKQMHKRLKAISRLKIMDLHLFRSIRRDYVKLTELCDIINDRISLVIIVCFAQNMYFILVQLFSSLRKIDSTVEKIYFYVSFGLLLTRTTCVCILGGGVYEEWRNIGTALLSIQSSAYNIEVQRLIDHVVTYELALTGRNFFKISRRLVLKIAGVIVTYELVLIQFNENADNG